MVGLISLKRRILMYLEAIFGLLTLVKYFAFGRLYDDVAVLVEDCALTSIVLQKSSNNGLLQDLFILYAWLEENPSVEIELEFCIFENRVLFKHLFKLKA